MDAITFGAFLKERRTAQDLTQAQLAETLHVTAKAVSRWERGVEFPDIQTLEPLAKALNVSLLELMQSREIREDTVSSEEASAAMANALAIMQGSGEAMRRSPLWWIYWAFSAIPAIFIMYIGDFHVESRELRATIHTLSFFIIYLVGDLVRLVIVQHQNPGIRLLSTRWPYLAALVARHLGFLIIAFSFLLNETVGTGAFIAAAVVGGLLALGSWLCFEFWKMFPLED